KATKTAFYSLERDITIASGTKLTLTFDGGAYGSTTPATIGDITWQMTLPTLPTSTRTGYTFDGWYNGATKLTTATKIEAAITYHAKWTANTYAVTFDANGGTGSIAPQSLVYDTAETALTTSTLTRENYKFAGWNTKKDGSGVSYKNKQSVKNLNDGLAFTLYAQWTENGHYNLSGKITDDTTANVADATVKLIRGKEVIATAMTDNKGDYFISNIRPGVYNMVVTKGERTLTILVTVTDKDVAQNAVLKKAASHSSVLEVTDEPDDPDDPSTPPVKTPDVMVGGLDEVAEDENASILMIVTGEKEDQANNEQQEIKKLEPGSYIQFLDMSITKTENGTQTSIVDTKNNILEVIVP
ncbi:MAG: InlB B-repeat-containing protein, partial [Evtepia sp.]